MKIDLTQDEPLSAYFTFALKFGRAQVWKLLGVVLLIGLPAIAMDMAGKLLDQQEFRDLAWLSFTFTYASDFIYYLAWSCVVLFMIGYLSDEKMSVGDVLFRSGGRLLKGFLSFCLVFLVQTGCLLIAWLLIMSFSGSSQPHPLLMVASAAICSSPLVWLSFFPFLVLIEKQPFMGALRESLRQVQQHWTGVAGMLIYLSILGLVVSSLVWIGNNTIAKATDAALGSFHISSFSTAVILSAIPKLPLLLLGKGMTLYFVAVFSLYFVNSRLVWSASGHGEGELPTEVSAEAVEVSGDNDPEGITNTDRTLQDI